VSRSAWKLDLARRFGADHVVGAGEDAAAAVGRLTAGAGADVVIDTAGGSELLALSMQILRPGGRLLLYAISHQPVEGLSTFPISSKERKICGARALTGGAFEPCIKLVAAGAIDLAPFVTAEYPLQRVASAFADYERAPERVLRLVIVPEAWITAGVFSPI